MPLLPNAIFIIGDTDIEIHVQNSERIEDTYKKEWCAVLLNAHACN